MIAGIFDEFLGVPTHPLAVHAPVVLVPLLAVASIIVLFRPTWRDRASIPFAGLAIIMVAMLFVAKESGEAVDDDIIFGNIDRHEDLANQTFILGIVWLVLALAAGVAAFIYRSGTAASLSASAASVDRSQVVLVLNVLATVALLVTTVWLIRTGHAGAESRWKI